MVYLLPARQMTIYQQVTVVPTLTSYMSVITLKVPGNAHRQTAAV